MVINYSKIFIIQKIKECGVEKMNYDIIVDIAQVISSFAMVISVIYLGIQIRHNQNSHKVLKSKKFYLKNLGKHQLLI